MRPPVLSRPTVSAGVAGHGRSAGFPHAPDAMHNQGITAGPRPPATLTCWRAPSPTWRAACWPTSRCTPGPPQNPSGKGHRQHPTALPPPAHPRCGLELAWDAVWVPATPKHATETTIRARRSRSHGRSTVIPYAAGRGVLTRLGTPLPRRQPNASAPYPASGGGEYPGTQAPKNRLKVPFGVPAGVPGIESWHPWGRGCHNGGASAQEGIPARRLCGERRTPKVDTS